MWYIATTRKASQLFLQEADQVEKLVQAGKIDEALNFIEQNEKTWSKWLTTTWEAIVKEVGTETYNNLLEAQGKPTEKAKVDAFNPWEETIRKYIKTTVAQKVTNVSDTTKKEIKKIIDTLRAEDSTMDQIARAIKQKFEDFSRYRAFRISRTEVVGASNFASIKSAEQSKVVDKKEWVSSRDSRVRDSHERVHGDLADLDKPFSNGLMFPGDYSAGRPGETIQCRCTIAYMTKEETVITPKPKPVPKPQPAPKPKPVAVPKPKPAPKPKPNADEFLTIKLKPNDKKAIKQFEKELGTQKFDYKDRINHKRNDDKSGNGFISNRICGGSEQENCAWLRFIFHKWTISTRKILFK